MFAIGVDYLNGWAMSTDTAHLNRPEWPPHPDRVYMAMVGAHFETSGDAIEYQALQWLERQPPPSIYASHAHHRQTADVFVPVNDTPAAKERLSLLPELRVRKPRQFPVAIPRESQVYMVYKEDPPSALRQALADICSKVIRVGHSASLVQAWVEESPPIPNLVPTGGVAQHWLRVSRPGRLDYLIDQYAIGQWPDEHPIPVAYAPAPPLPPPDIPGGQFHHELLVLRRVGGQDIGLEQSLRAALRLRRAIIKYCPPDVPEWVSGHLPDGSPSRTPHISLLPLPFVDHEHADGHLLGFAIAIPKHITHQEVGRCLSPLMGATSDGSLRRVHLYDNNGLDWVLEWERGDFTAQALRPEAWTGAAMRWATVTPFVFDRHVKGKDKEEKAISIVRDACRRSGFPDPEAVALHDTSLFRGVPPSRSFPVMRRQSDNGRKFQRHAVITFAEPVMGPVLLGAGRHKGYGVCRPVTDYQGGGNID